MRQCHRMSEKTAPIAQSRTPTIKDTQKFLAKITRLLNMDNITTTNKKQIITRKVHQPSFHPARGKKEGSNNQLHVSKKDEQQECQKVIIICPLPTEVDGQRTTITQTI